MQSEVGGATSESNPIPVETLHALPPLLTATQMNVSTAGFSPLEMKSMEPADAGVHQLTQASVISDQVSVVVTVRRGPCDDSS